MSPDNEDVIGIVDDELHTERELALVKEIRRLRADVEKAKRSAKVPKGLSDAKRILRPIYDALRILFEEVKDSDGAGSASSPAWLVWQEKAGGGARGKMLAVVIERGDVTRAQLATLAGVSIRSSTFSNGLSWMRSNRLIDVEGQILRRAQL